MSGQKKDSLLLRIEKALDLGRFITYKARWGFVNGLDDVKSELNDLVKQGDMARAVRLYELFIARTGVKKRWYRCNGPYRSFIRCKNKSVKAQEIESEVAEILETLLKNDKLKTSRWMNVTPAEIASSAASPPPRNDEGIKVLKNRLDSNLKKQSKLTDAYLENLLSEELYKQKNESLRQEEEELKKLIALQEVRDIERERSKDYLDRVEEFISGYDPNKKEMDSLTKKLMLNLLFKNIKIAPPTPRLRRAS